MPKIGLIHGRSPSQGGPLYTLACPHCNEKLIAERADGAGYRFLDRHLVAALSPLRRKLASFLRAPKTAPGAKTQRTARDGGARSAGAGARARPVRDERLSPQLAVLDLAPHATLVEVRSRFRALAKQLHPDRLSNRPEQERRTAERRLIEVVRAYKQILAEWGA